LILTGVNRKSGLGRKEVSITFGGQPARKQLSQGGRKMNEAFEKWWSETVSRGYETKKLDEMYKVVTQAAFEAGRSESAARIGELETERDKIYKAFVGRDGMHMSLYDALAEIFNSYWGYKP
jgi:hypothetical protein